MGVGVGDWEQSVTLYRDTQHGASVDLGLQTEIMIMPVKTTEQNEIEWRKGERE